MKRMNMRAEVEEIQSIDRNYQFLEPFERLPKRPDFICTLKLCNGHV